MLLVLIKNQQIRNFQFLTHESLKKMEIIEFL